MDIEQMAMEASATVKAQIDWSALWASVQIEVAADALAERQNQRLDALERELKGQA